MLFTYAIIIAIIATILASVVDLKKREIPNWINYSLIGIALLLRVVYSFFQGFSVILEGILSGILFFIIAYALYRLGQWGGGDVLLLTGLAILFGLPRLDSFMLFYIIALLFAGAMWGILYAGFILLINRKKIKYVPLKYSNSITLLTLLLVLISILYIQSILFSLLIFLFLILYWTLPLLKQVDEFLIKEITTKEVVEGDWLAQSIKLQGKTYTKKGIGLTPKEVEEFHKHNKKVKVKDGIPFAPSFVLALALAWYFPELILIFL